MPRPPPPTVSFPIGESTAYLLRDTWRALSRVMENRIGRAGVSMSMWFFLRVLWEEEGLTQRELSRRVKMMEPTAVATLNKMEKAGLIRRTRSEVDRRRIHVSLTARGRALERQLLPLARDVNRVVLAGLSAAEEVALREILRKVKANLEADDAAGTPRLGSGRDEA